LSVVDAVFVFEAPLPLYNVSIRIQAGRIWAISML
jgi:hypothetical protein